MQSLGLHKLAQVSSVTVTNKQPKQRRPAAKPKDAAPQRSYSLRNRGKPAAGAPHQAEPSQEPDPTVQPPAAARHFDDSSVISYMCQQVPEPSRQASAADHKTTTGFSEMAGWLTDSKLARAYSMDASDMLLAAGGKNGHASVFGIQQALAGEEGGTGPLLSAKLHKSWIADVQLLPADGLSLHAAALPTLLTASNDGSVRLWDLSKGCEGMPLELAQTDDLHTGGIWSMQCRAGKIATASKDCSLVVSGLCPEGTIVALSVHPQQHAGAVKCTRWSSDHVLATCGNDMCIKVMDTRNSNGSQQTIEAAHDGCVNCVRWHPSSEHLLVSSGTDPCLHLWDLRHSQQPLFTFQGHTPMSRCAQMYQAEFVPHGSAVACSGPKSMQLSLYCTSSGRSDSSSSTLYCSQLRLLLLASTCLWCSETGLMC
ncbi:GATOR complex protein wdr59, variant 2 [Trebouxia sp. C0010 RCD-2024]